MNNTKSIWILVGRETEGNNTKNYIFMNYNGGTQFVQKRSIIKFCKEHEVLNAQILGNGISGKGMAITSLPRYVKQPGFGLQQISGMSQEQVLQLAQPLINQYIQKKKQKTNKNKENNLEAKKNKQNEYILNKLDIIENLINIALSMKDITNELASNGNFTRYLKQIDIDNAEGDSLTNIIRSQGVLGLANGLIDRLNKLDSRISKYNLDKNFRIKIKELKEKCENIKKLHSDTKRIIKSNKKQDEEQKELLDKQFTKISNISDVFNLEDIPVVNDNEDDIIAIDESNISSDNKLDIPIIEDKEIDEAEVIQCDFVKITDINDVFKQNESSKNDKEIQNKIDELCDLYSKAVTNIGNIIHNPSRIAEIAHDIDMEYPGVHKRITKDKINSHYDSEEDVVQDISKHYDYITAEENRGNLWHKLLNTYLGKTGTEICKMTFKAFDYPDDSRLNKNIELFDYYMNTLIKSIIDKLSEDKEQCIQKALQNFTKLSSSKREQILSELYEDNWKSSGESYYDAYYSFGSSTYSDGYNMARRETLKKYEGLSDEEFIASINNVKKQRLINKRAKLMLSAFPEEINNIYLEKHNIKFGQSYLIPNYDRGETKHREKISIAAEILRSSKSELLELSDNEFESNMRVLSENFENNIRLNIQNMVNEVINTINNLSIDDVEDDGYYSVKLNKHNIYKDINAIKDYCFNVEHEYSIYLHNNNPFDRSKLRKMLENKEDSILNEYNKQNRMKSSKRTQPINELNDISDLFLF